MSTINTSSLLQMRASILQQNSALQKASAGSNAVDGLQTGAAAPGADGGSVGKADFGSAMRSAISEVNKAQGEASSATEAYDRGETTDIAAVMLQREKASVSFQATLQVRNKLLSAYKEIMSMSV